MRDDDDIRFVLDQQAEFAFYCDSSLKQQLTGVDMSLHFRKHYSDSEPAHLYVLLLNTSCLAEKQRN